ncbi:hypothetical protein [Devosia sp. CN2-171]|jgi:hypothetical protein
MTPEQLILAAALGLRNRYAHGIDDRLLADMGLTPEEAARQQRWFRRKAR